MISVMQSIWLRWSRRITRTKEYERGARSLKERRRKKEAEVGTMSFRWCLPGRLYRWSCGASKDSGMPAGFYAWLVGHRPSGSKYRKRWTTKILYRLRLGMLSDHSLICLERMPVKMKGRKSYFAIRPVSALISRNCESNFIKIPLLLYIRI